MCLDWDLIKRMLRFGLPNGVHLALDLIAFNTFGLLLGCYGVAVHEASGITFGINNIAFCPIIGVGMAASILVGQAVGAEEIPLAKKALRSCLLLAVGYTLLMVLLFSVFFPGVRRRGRIFFRACRIFRPVPDVH
jgi:MATE family multidrug resistance protein